jgi:hypothetical protein
MLFTNCCRPFAAVVEVCTTNAQKFGVRENEMNGSDRLECIKDDVFIDYVFFLSSIIIIHLFTRQPLVP